MTYLFDDPSDVIDETTSRTRPPFVIATPPRDELEGLRCLSVRQPWASLIVGGRKWAENRTWTTSHRGRIGVHCSKSPADPADVSESSLSTGEGLPLGVLLGFVNVVAVVEKKRGKTNFARSVAAMAEAGHPLDDAALGDGETFVEPGSPFVWLLANPVRFQTPVPVRGQTSLWKFPV